MSNLLKALNALGEVKLSSEKVELGVADDVAKQESILEGLLADVKAQVSEMTKANNAIIKANKDADKVQEKADKAKDKASKSNMKAAGLLDKVESLGKELGVDPKQIKGYTNLAKLYDKLEDEFSKINNFNWVSAS